MLPNMARTVRRFASPYTVKTVTKQTVDFVEQNTVTDRTIDAVIQVADKNKLNSDQIDWSLAYILIHTVDSVENGELIEYQGEDYKLINNGDWLPYGYMEVVAEQTKRPVVQVT